MTAPLVDVVAVQQASLPAGTPQGAEDPFVPISSGEASESHVFSLVLEPLVDEESAQANEGEGDGELLETLDGVAGAPLPDTEGALSADAPAETAAELGALTEGNPSESAREGAVQPGTASTGTELGRPGDPAIPLIPNGAPQTEVRAPVDPNGHAGTPVPDGFVPSEEPSSSEAVLFSHASTGALGGNASETGRPEAAPAADARDSSALEPRAVEATALRSDAGDSSSAESHQPPSGNVRGGEPDAAFEPLISRVEGAPRSESAPLQGPPRALPELPASNENAIVGGARMLANEGGGTARIQLFPPQLGGLEIRVTVNQRAVQLTIVADRAAVANLMQHHLPELRHVLQLPGLAVERVEIAYREPGVSEDNRGARPDEGLVGREDSGEPQERSGYDEDGSRGVEPWSSDEALDPRFPGRSELRWVTSLGTIDLRA